ncbi:MAG: hypothetical protein ROD09_11760 [Candidatus Sedimenticola sp. (ex Thyasira tokunagai)]
MTLISGSTINDDDDTGAAIAAMTIGAASGGRHGGPACARAGFTDGDIDPVTITGGNNVTG